MTASQGLKKFQSTLPAKGATTSEKIYTHKDIISIHAPRKGSDYWLEASE